jgi:hypothetical protein
MFEKVPQKSPYPKAKNLTPIATKFLSPTNLCLLSTVHHPPSFTLSAERIQASAIKLALEPLLVKNTKQTKNNQR